MKKHRYILACVLLLLPLACSFGLEDDLVFEEVGGEDNDNDSLLVGPALINHATHGRSDRYEHRSSSRDSRTQPSRVERAWGVSDSVVPVGHVFRMKIPRQAFSGDVDFYEVRRTNDRDRFPKWMHWDEAAATLLGVPLKEDTGNYHLTVTAFGKHGDTAKDQFVVQVVSEKLDEVKHKDGTTHCDDGEEQTVLMILLDAVIEKLSPIVKTNAIENLAGFLGMHTSAFSMHSQNIKAPDFIFMKTSSILGSSSILSGPGNIKPNKHKKNHLAIQWQVGCNGQLWKHQAQLIRQLREQAVDGTLAEVLQLPVISWRVRIDSSPSLRNRREVGSGDYDDDYDEEYEDKYYEENYDEEDEDSQVQPTYMPDVKIPEHPHRHHHGEETIDWKSEDVDEEEIIPRMRQSELENKTITTTTTELTTSSPSTTTSTTTTTTSTTTTQVAPTTVPTTASSTTTTTASADITTTTTTTASISTAVDPSIESPRSETTNEESSTETKHVDRVEPVTILPTAPSEITTTPLLTTTPLSLSTAATSQTTVPDRVETEIVIGINNVTTEEPEQTTTSMKEPSTTLPTPMVITDVSITTPSSVVTNVSTTITTTTTPVSVINATTTTTDAISSTPELRTTLSTIPSSTSTTTTTTTTTTAAPTTTTTTTTTTAKTTTESIEYGPVNSPPRRDKRLKKIPVTAGKPLSYVIPANTFADSEDGDTRKLKLSLYWHGAPLKTTHWLQFNHHLQKIYGLPLEKDISTWNYELVATDSEGANVSDSLDIHVQQHKSSRSVNHEFTIYLRIDKRNEFPTDVDWESKVIHNLAEVYGGNTQFENITVRSIEINTSDREQVIFTWTNDNVPRSSDCPKKDINDLWRVLVDTNGDPSSTLRKVFAPEITIKRVVFQGIGQCEDMNRPEEPKVSTEEPKTNYPPVPRNQVDHVNATVGQLLVFKVPEDTFFDFEDGSSRNMKMSLLTIDRTAIPSHEWLQFDSKNQEFYGVPMRTDIGRKEYQLVVTDKEGASSTDGLVVVVHPATPMAHTVEFSMTLDIPYDSFAHSALQKRNFIEKLRDLYGDRDTTAISLHSISNGSTVITWHNRTLPTSYCAHEEVNRLRSVLVKSDNDRRSVTDEVLDVMGQKFPVKQITVIPMGICLGELTGVHSPDSYVPPVDDSTSVGAFHDDYLLTFVLPAIIIAIMLILAGIIACVLHRRRRSGKMSVSEQDDERQSFRSKGIPVIFQDELEEKPDPGNKSPVILKEEKPPLPPPEYQKAEDGADVPMLSKENSEEPYQPPPPFATNRDTNRQNRPKPTPTYRKPPPYVPP
ncbi:dystroglycan isoform X1 [Nylanderia fulva]|uniref:dystroglycan isoform X1 n=1 Tax=Nylanderia fulva TaxID=613905 RepID=UPI0010FAD8AD|nr:dystroglycan isoform X1 [Nylanderia fulva]XP_029165407.1 dystroglycan isoform X1 [Nylanderia fulva]XP_029165408.1 dystroglycan isoform X1 [Nylanderia fulva]